MRDVRDLAEIQGSGASVFEVYCDPHQISAAHRIAGYFAVAAVLHANSVHSPGSLWLIAVSAMFVIGSLWLIATPVALAVLFAWLFGAAGLVTFAVVVMRAGRRLPSTAEEDTEADRRAGRQFLWVVAAEVLGFAIVNPLAVMTGHFAAMAALNLLVVGLHFIPLSWVFKIPRYWVMGVLLCLVSALTLVAIPQDTVLGHTLAWSVVPSLGCGLVATLVGAVGLLESRRYVMEIHRG